MRAVSQILVTKPGVLNQRDKTVLRKAGVVCVEAEDPSEVRLIQTEGAPLTGGDMLFAALSGVMKGSTYAKNEFAEVVFKLVEATRKDDT